MRTDIDERKQEILGWLDEGQPRAEIARRLKCKESTLKSRLDRWGIKKSNQGRRGTVGGSYRPASLYLGTGNRITSYKLKLKLWREKLKDKSCERCGVTDWFGSFEHLELDHINGDRFDNRLENLRILCANCHALTPTNSGKNSGNY